MSRQEREDFIARKILEALDDMRGMSPARVLFSAVECLVNPPPLVSEFETALQRCQREGWIIGVRPDLGPTKWRLTDNGRGVLLNSR